MLFLIRGTKIDDEACGFERENVVPFGGRSRLHWTPYSWWSKPDSFSPFGAPSRRMDSDVTSRELPP